MREQARQMVVEGMVGPDDHRHGRRHGLVDVAGGQERAQALLGGGGLQEDEARRLRVGRGRPLHGKLVEPAQHGVVNRLVQPGGVRARVKEELAEGVVVEGGGHLVLSAWGWGRVTAYSWAASG
jgi:hypothetical protein